MKNTFLNDLETREKLALFISEADKLSMHEKCAKFEREFAEFQGCKEAILFNSGGSANLSILQTLKNLGKLKDGDKVGFSDTTWSTNVMPIIQLQLRPVPVDCSVKTLNVMSDNFRERLRDISLEALFITNVLGFAGDLGTIKQICEEKGIIFIEDNCEAIGTELASGKTGNFGLMSSFSFFATHQLSTIEGGMVCTNDEESAEMLKIVRSNGWCRNLTTQQQNKWRERYNINSELDSINTFFDLGYNLKPTEVTGYLGVLQLPFLKEVIQLRERQYIILEEISLKNPDFMRLDRSNIKLLSNFAFPVLAKNPDLKSKYVAKFENNDIEIRPIIGGNIQNHPFYKKYVSECYEVPDSEFINNCGFYCGNYPELTDNDIEMIKVSMSH